MHGISLNLNIYFWIHSYSRSYATFYNFMLYHLKLFIIAVFVVHFTMLSVSEAIPGRPYDGWWMKIEDLKSEIGVLAFTSTNWEKTIINFGQDSGILAKILTEYLPNTCLLQCYRHINLLSFTVFLDVTPTQLLYLSVNN